MKILYKQYLGDYNEIPNDAYIFGDELITSENDKYTMDNSYCFEVNIINKIIENDERYFDFSKSMIDIGSEYGEYSYILPFNYSYLFDGNKDKCIIAQFNMLLHNKSNQFTYYNTLLSDKIENVQYNGFHTNYTDFIKNGEYNYLLNDSINIQSTILDSYNLNDIGFIKIDVEGMEEKVLRGGLGTIIRNNYPPILFELWDVGYYGMTKEKHDSLQNFLESFGYEILWHWGDYETHLAIHK